MKRGMMNEPKIIVEECRKMSTGMSFSAQHLNNSYEDFNCLHPLRAASGSASGSKYSLPFPSDSMLHESYRRSDHTGRRSRDDSSYLKSSSSGNVSSRVPESFFRSLTQGASTPNLRNVSSKGKKVLGIAENPLGQSKYYLEVPLKATYYVSKSTSELEKIMEEEKERLLKLKRFDLSDPWTIKADEHEKYKKGWFMKNHLSRKLKKFGSSLSMNKSKKDVRAADQETQQDRESWDYFVERCLFDDSSSIDEEERKRAKRDKNNLKNTIEMIWTRFKLNWTLSLREPYQRRRK